MTKKRTIFFHIGSGKAGTKTIQRFFEQNRDALRKKGIFYPKLPDKYPCNNDYVNAHQVIDLLIENKNEEAEVALNKLIEQSNGEEDILISEERFITRLDILHSLIDTEKYNIKIIFYIRNPFDYITSLWCQMNKNGNQKKPAPFNYLNKLLENLDDSGWINTRLSDIIKTPFDVEKYFGKHNLILKVFEKEQFKENDLMIDFLDIFKIADLSDCCNLEKILNISPDRRTTEKLVVLNRSCIPLSEPTYNIIRYNILNQSSTQKIVDTLTDKQIELLYSKFYPSFCKLSQEFLGREELFINKYPKIYKTKRESYEELTQVDLAELKIAIDYAQNNQLINTIIKREDNGIVTRKMKTNLLCALIPSKKYRNKIRRKLNKIS